MPSAKYPQLADKAWLEDQYVTRGKSCEEIAAAVGCGKGTVEYRLHTHKIPVRGRYPGKWKPKTCARVECGKLFTPDGPAQKFCSLECRPDLRTCERPGCGKSFKPKSPQRRSSHAGGGHGVYPQKYCSFECRQLVWAQQSRDRQTIPTLYRRLTMQGYVEVNVGSRNGGRVRENRWAVEQRLLRPLLPDEEVHHKNGDKLDDDLFCPVCHPEPPLAQGEPDMMETGTGRIVCRHCSLTKDHNLELWTRSQPRGQRVDDKIAWAIAFLQQYGHQVILPSKPILPVCPAAALLAP